MLVSGKPDALDTLAKLAAALGCSNTVSVVEDGPGDADSVGPNNSAELIRPRGLDELSCLGFRMNERF